MSTDEIERLIEKLKRIEALHAGAGTEGERIAAANARDRIKEKLQKLESTDPAQEFSFTLNNQWSRRLFLALLRRYDLRPYRYKRQRRNTVMVRVSKRFVEETLWPEFVELDLELTLHLEATAQRIINESIFKDSTEAEEV